MDQRDPQTTGRAAWFDKANLLSYDWAKDIKGMTIGETINLAEVMQYAIVQVINKYYVKAAEESSEKT